MRQANQPNELCPHNNPLKGRMTWKKENQKKKRISINHTRDGIGHGHTSLQGRVREDNGMERVRGARNHGSRNKNSIITITWSQSRVGCNARNMKLAITVCK
jgi:hypothetical protein